ncbi:hypothetical protein [Ralstonia insidiosa]|uniref:Uncharacterized protein n=1 Tax=Ralstonia insidiosa TaxID=190721 RepID=A0A848NSZ3_9RALS|nr:hypothetical protein [Ralstonia insidiosa]NMV38271.1 hypothetical protein [Ralstonia insidiosa]
MWIEACTVVVSWVVVFGLFVFGVLKAVGRWNSVRLFAFPSGGLTRTFAGAAPAWGDHFRWARRSLLTSLRMRDEAWLQLDGELLDLADEYLREDLHNLGGLAGAW